MKGRRSQKEDVRLSNWDRWLRIRKLQHEKLCKALNKDPKCLVMNRDELWEMNRDRCMISAATELALNQEDKIPYLNARCMAPIEPAKYRTERFEKPKRNIKDYWGTPDEILISKGLGGEGGCLSMTEKWRRSQVVKARKDDLSEELGMLEMDEDPDIRNMIIIGKEYRPPPTPMSVPEIDVTEAPDVDCKRIETIPELVLVVGDKLVLKPDHTDEHYIHTVQFIGCFAKEVYHKSLTLQNRCTTAIHFAWNQLDFNKLYRLPFKHITNQIPRFFFKHVDGIILPGQTYTVDILFHSEYPGIYRKRLQLITNPLITRNHPIIELEGIASSKETTPPWNYIRDYIDDCIELRRKDAEECKAMSTKAPEFSYYHRLINEKIAFNNSNPGFNYIQNEVHKLKTIWDKYLSHLPWNYSLAVLAFNIHLSDFTSSQKAEFLDTFFKCTKMLQITHQPNEPCFDDKYDTVYTILNEMITTFVNVVEEIRKKYALPSNPSQILEDTTESLTDSPLPPKKEIPKKRTGGKGGAGKKIKPKKTNERMDALAEIKERRIRITDPGKVKEEYVSLYGVYTPCSTIQSLSSHCEINKLVHENDEEAQSNDSTYYKELYDRAHDIVSSAVGAIGTILSAMANILEDNYFSCPSVDEEVSP